MAQEELEIHLNDINVIFEIALLDANKAAFDISGATTLEILFLKSDGNSKLTKTAVLSSGGVDGKLKYASIAGDLDQKGDWQIQAYIVSPGFSGHSSIGQFEVFKNL